MKLLHRSMKSMLIAAFCMIVPLSFCFGKIEKIKKKHHGLVMGHHAVEKKPPKGALVRNGDLNSPEMVPLQELFPLSSLPQGVRKFFDLDSGGTDVK